MSITLFTAVLAVLAVLAVSASASPIHASVSSHSELRSSNWCGTHHSRHGDSNEGQTLTEALNPLHSASRHLAASDTPPTTCHPVSHCDVPQTMLAYLSALPNLPTRTLTMFILQLTGPAGSAYPTTAHTTGVMSTVNAAYADSRVQFEPVFKSFPVDVPNAKFVSSLVSLRSCAPSWVGDGYCDDSCLSPYTDYDGGDCSHTELDTERGSLLVRSCPASLRGNGVCDPQCNNKAASYDDGDCCPSTNPNYAASHPNGLAMSLSARYSSSGSFAGYDVGGCINPSATTERQWKGSLRGESNGEFKALFADCTHDGVPCAERGVVTMIPARLPGLLGVATFPWDSGVFTMTGGGMLINGEAAWSLGSEPHSTTVIHELGHCMGLFHTHYGVSDIGESSCSSPCYELPPLANEESSLMTGDLCADTRPTTRNYKCEDPGQTSQCNSRPFVQTPFRNFMGYSDDSCMDEFSPQQNARARCYADIAYAQWTTATSNTQVTSVVRPPLPSAASGGITVSWEPPVGTSAFVSGARYLVTRTPALPDSVIPSDGLTSPSFLDTDVTTGQSYTYTVTVLSGGVQSAPSPASPSIVWTGGASTGPTCSGTLSLTMPATVPSSLSFSDGSLGGLYSPNLDCSFAIAAGDDTARFTVTFSQFDVEGPEDTVTVTAGGVSSLVSSTSGLPDPLSLPGAETLSLQFNTDGSKQGNGWTVTIGACRESDCGSYGQCGPTGGCECDVGFSGTQCESCAPGYTGFPNCRLPTTSTCSGTTSVGPASASASMSGSFGDGSDGDPYANNLNCDFVVSAPSMTTPPALLLLSFSSFATESNYDVVTVWSGSEPSGEPIISPASGPSPPFVPAIVSTARSSSPSALVRFTTDSSVTNDGWQASWAFCFAYADCSARGTCASPALCECGPVSNPSAVTCYQCPSSVSTTASDTPFCGECPAPATIGNGVCDSGNNIPACGYDGGDCAVPSPEPVVVTAEVFIVGGPSATTTSTSAEFRWECSTAACTYTVSLDGGPSAVATSPHVLVDLAPGDHVFAITPTSQTGDVGPVREYRWTIQAPLCEAEARLSVSRGSPVTFSDGSAAGANALHNTNCQWTLATDPDSVLTLSFDRFSVETSTACFYDAVLVYDSTDTSGAPLATLCGSVIPSPITSTTNTLVLVFFTDGSVGSTGWQATATAAAPGPSTPTTPGCSGTITLVDESGTVTDGSGVSANYVNNQNCVFVIDLPVDRVITFTQTDFHLEDRSTSGGHCWDSVEVFLGTEVTAFSSSPLWSGCGTESMPAAGVVVPGGQAVVRFLSDSSIVAAGFSLSYTTTVGSECCNLDDLEVAHGQYTCHPSTCYADSPFCYLECDDGFFPTDETSSASLTCSASGTWIDGVTLDSFVPGRCEAAVCPAEAVTVPSDGTHASFSDGTAPIQSYMNNMHCQQVFSGPAGSMLEFRFSRMDVESSVGCFYDALTIADPDGTVVQTLCSESSSPPAPVMVASPATLTFRTDHSVTGDGYAGVVVAHLPETCSGLQHLTGTSGTLSSNPSTTLYPEDTTCEWVLAPVSSSSSSNAFTLTITRFNVPSASATGCPGDSLQIFAGTETTSTPAEHVLCGDQTLPLTLSLTGPAVYVRFTSDGSRVSATGESESGFDVSYTMTPSSTSCTGTHALTAETGTLSDGTAAGNDYDNYLNCVWTIDASGTAPAGSVLEITVTRLDIEEATGCIYDALIIANGVQSSPLSTSDASDVSVLCGTVIPATLSTTGPSATIQFTTDFSVTNTGWELSWRTVSATASSCAAVESTSTDPFFYVYTQPPNDAGRYTTGTQALLHCRTGYTLNFPGSVTSATRVCTDGGFSDALDLEVECVTYAEALELYTTLGVGVECNPDVCSAPGGLCVSTGCSCNPGYSGDACTYFTPSTVYVIGATEWSTCSNNCGTDGVRTRELRCQSYVPGTAPDLVDVDMSFCVPDGSGPPPISTEEACGRVSCGETVSDVSLVLRVDFDSILSAAALDRFQHDFVAFFAEAAGETADRFELLSLSCAQADGSACSGGSGARRLQSSSTTDDGRYVLTNTRILPGSDFGSLPPSSVASSLETQASDPASPLNTQGTFSSAVASSTLTTASSTLVPVSPSPQPSEGGGSNTGVIVGVVVGVLVVGLVAAVGLFVFLKKGSRRSGSRRQVMGTVPVKTRPNNGFGVGGAGGGAGAGAGSGAGGRNDIEMVNPQLLAMNANRDVKGGYGGGGGGGGRTGPPPGMKGPTGPVPVVNAQPPPAYTGFLTPVQPSSVPPPQSQAYAAGPPPSSGAPMYPGPSVAMYPQQAPPRHPLYPQQPQQPPRQPAPDARQTFQPQQAGGRGKGPIM